MAKYECILCGYIYEEEKGVHESGVSPGTKWEDLPDSFVCPVCGATKSMFKKLGSSTDVSKPKAKPASDPERDMRELSPIELGALCTNLARGCEKQYKFEEAALFSGLSEYFKSSAVPEENPNYDELTALIDSDLNDAYPSAFDAAEKAADRGAKRALVWSDKVTKILKSILTRYEREGDKLLENTGVYVCTICGFVYVGDNLPEICPVCKVPNRKFDKIVVR
jgi:rubredoxin